jgi:iron-sulfur cluster assembly protein
METQATPTETAPTTEVNVTPKAVTKAVEALAKRGTPDAMLRLGVRGGGCSGFSYTIEFADGPSARDRVFEFGPLKVVVDPKSLVFLRGTTLDYETKLMSHGFKLVNPNEKSACGCGDSFTV